VGERLQQWQAEGIEMAPVAINLSLSRLQADELSEDIQALIERYDIDPSWLELEISEPNLHQLSAAQLERLRRLQRLGVGLTLDDFGCSGLDPDQIRHLPFSRIKLDRSFIRDIRNTSDDNVLLSATISLAQRLGVKVAAKGVETPDQLVYLKLAGCDEVQGHLFSRALSPDEVLEYLNQPKQDIAV
jgi:EAL domain-containing protein (putative c-di-GMP-specific phosphodiesterase class I)